MYMMEATRFIGIVPIGTVFQCPNCGFRIIEQTKEEADREERLWKEVESKLERKTIKELKEGKIW